MAPVIDQCPVRWQAINNGEAIAVQTDQQAISYIELDKRVTNLQMQLLKQVISPADKTPIRIACIASNGIELLLLQLVCIRSDWIFCPLNPRFTPVEIEQRLSILATEYCWACPSSAPTHQNTRTLTINFSALSESLPSSLKTISIQPQQPCNIIFTSGSTGFPKAIVHHYQNHFYSALGSHTLIPIQQGDNNLLSLPVFHIGGYATVIRTLLAGACIHITQNNLSCVLLVQRKITHLSLVSTQLTRLLTDTDFIASRNAIKHILLGGSAFSPSQLQALATRQFNYHLSYGCTEMTSQVATSENNDKLRLLKHRELKIKQGEIYLRGKTRFLGYFKNNKIVKIASEEWVSSGDIGSYSHGRLCILGRKDRQFISGGENIHPEEIERVCLQHSSVKQVYACAINDNSYGYRVALFVDFMMQRDACFEQQCKHLTDYLCKQLTRFKRPDQYFNWPSSNANQQALKIPKQTFQDILKNKGLI